MASLPAARAVLAACLLGCVLPLYAKTTHTEAEKARALETLFSSIDVNHDGQLDAAETEQYAAASLDLLQEGWSARDASNAAQALDGPDAGATVSKAELAAHLTALLQDHRVEDWVSHGLNLPQYAAAFRQAAITALDFPFLVSDGGASLQAELGVVSKLHQLQILRGLKRLILGLGELPGAPRQLECAAANRSAVRLSWRAPRVPGHPALHKYALQRQRVVAAAGSAGAAAACAAGLGDGAGSGPRQGGVCVGVERWEAAGEPDDEDSSWVDLPPARGSYRYRLAAWSAFGRSEYAVSGAACEVRAVHQRPPPSAPLPPAEVQALLAAVAATGSLSAGRTGGAAPGGAAGAGVWSWSAASSAAVVALTILLKASQLKAGGLLLALWRSLTARVRRPAAGAAAGAADGAEQQQEQQQEGGRDAAWAGMPRARSSQALLAALGSGAAAADEQQQRVGVASGGSMLRSYSSTQLLGEQGGQLGSMGVEAAGWDAAAEAGEMDDAAAEQLQLAIQRGTRCAHPGCHRRFDRLRDMRRKLESHYCCLCQYMYCLQHTRISPHGPRGGCGLESQCICHACFAELAPAQQAACERNNRLPRSSAPSAAPSAADANGAPPVGDSLAPGTADEAAGSADATAEPTTTLEAAASAGAPEELQPAAGSGSSPLSVARQRWRTAGAAMRALVRFKAAGSNSTSPC